VKDAAHSRTDTAGTARYKRAFAVQAKWRTHVSHYKQVIASFGKIPSNRSIDGGDSVTVRHETGLFWVRPGPAW
jgi:hypothetical protein